MPHAFSRALFAALAIATAGTSAGAVTIAYLEDHREFHAFSYDSSADPPETETATVSPSPAFSDFSTGVAFPAAAASQVSLLRETSMWADGHAAGVPDVQASGTAYSLFRVVFSVDEATPWTLSGTLSRAATITGYNSGTAQVVLSVSGGSVIFSQALPPNPFPSATYFDPLTVPVSATGALAAGAYELLIRADSAVSGAPGGTATFDFNFALVPEPGPGVLLLVGLTSAGLWRLRRLRG